MKEPKQPDCYLVLFLMLQPVAKSVLDLLY
jgi:hypothetical protein